MRTITCTVASAANTLTVIKRTKLTAIDGATSDCMAHALNAFNANLAALSELQAVFIK